MRLSADILFFIRSNFPSASGGNGNGWMQAASGHGGCLLLLDTWDLISSSGLSLLYAGFTLLLCASLVIGTAIQCWPSAEFPSAWVQFTDQFCWLQGTQLWFKQHKDDRDYLFTYHQNITYYQWLPYYFIFLAVINHVPTFLWSLSICREGEFTSSTFMAPLYPPPFPPIFPM